MTDLPDPPVAAAADLRALPDMPLGVLALQRSKFWLGCRQHPALAYYAINLWTAAWHELPAGSLEDDDEILSALAHCDKERWGQIRAHVLHGWRKCSDGRLYHFGIATRVNEALAAKPKPKAKKAAASPAARRKCPDDFTLTDELKAWASGNAAHADVKVETAKFRDHTFASARTDWVGTWRNWMRRASETAQRGANRGQAPVSQDGIFAGVK